MKRAAATLLAGFLLAGGAAAQVGTPNNPNVLVTGTLIDSGPGGYDENTRMTCRGIPTCTGSYKAHVRQANCTNYLEHSGNFNATGLNLAQSGTLQGQISAIVGYRGSHFSERLCSSCSASSAVSAR